MDPLTQHVLGQAASADNGTTLLGIAAIITAVGTILAVLRSYLKKNGSTDENGLAADARERIRLLKATIGDLERNLTQARLDRDMSAAESRLKDRHIGMLEKALADARQEHDECQRNLAKYAAHDDEA